MSVDWRTGEQSAMVAPLAKRKGTHEGCPYVSVDWRTGEQSAMVAPLAKRKGTHKGCPYDGEMQLQGKLS